MRLLSILVSIFIIFVFCFVTYRAYKREVKVIPVVDLPLVKACPCVTTIRDSGVGGIFIPNQDKYIYKSFKNTITTNEGISNVDGDKSEIGETNVIPNKTDKQNSSRNNDKSLINSVQNEVLQILKEREMLNKDISIEEPDDLFDVLNKEVPTIPMDKAERKDKDVFYVLDDKEGNFTKSAVQTSQ